MTDSNYTHISLVVDRSGSMQRIKSDAEGAINAFIDEQKKAPGRATFTLVQFDSAVETVYEHVDLQSVEKYTLVPRNMTALLDAWGQTMSRTGEWLASLDEDARPANVIFVVVTDGAENASQEYTRQVVKEMTERQQNDYSWQVVFLAANMDAVQVGASFGVSRGSSLTYGATAQGTQASYAGLSKAVTAVRSGVKSSINFTDEDRQAAK
jgi:uncharacterized protein YegL